MNNVIEVLKFSIRKKVSTLSCCPAIFPIVPCPMGKGKLSQMGHWVLLLFEDIFYLIFALLF